MRLNLSYFAWVREAMGRSEESIDVPDDANSIADLVTWLANRDTNGAHAFADPARIRAAVDGVMVDRETPLAGARDVALFPPVTGG